MTGADNVRRIVIEVPEILREDLKVAKRLAGRRV